MLAETDEFTGMLKLANQAKRSRGSWISEEEQRNIMQCKKTFMLRYYIVVFLRVRLGFSALIINLTQLLFSHKQKKGFQALGGTLVLMRQWVLVKYD